MASTSRPTLPFALALLYDPTAAGAIAAGVELPISRSTLPIPFAVAEAAGVPPPTADPSSSSSTPAKLLGTSTDLPAFLYPSTKSIEPRNFKQAQAFVRFQTYRPELGPLPEPSPDDRPTSAIVYPASFGQADSLDSLLASHVYDKDGVVAVIKRHEGPIRIILHQIQISSAPEVLTLIGAKVDIGWAFSPGTMVLGWISNISKKMRDLETVDLPMLAAHPNDKTAADRCLRRLNVIKDNMKKAKRAVQGRVTVPTDQLNEISRAVKRLHQKKEHNLQYLEDRLPEFVQILQAVQTRVVVFNLKTISKH